MASKINTLTIVCHQGAKPYCVGSEYNGLLLDHIEDKSIEYPEAITILYVGYTKDGDIVFEAINAPIDVAYQRVEDEE